MEKHLLSNETLSRLDSSGNPTGIPDENREYQ